jgi:hypothetical protein
MRLATISNVGNSTDSSNVHFSPVTATDGGATVPMTAVALAPAW